LMLEASVYQWAELLTCIREVYEAVALVSFMELMLTILGGTQHLAVILVDESYLHSAGVPQPVPHVFPLCKILPAYQAGPQFLKSMLLGIFQYVFVCLAYMAVTCLIWALDVFGLLPPRLFVALKVVPNVTKAASCAWALNCLLLFAHEVYAHVPPCGLFLKFLSIKGIVFFTFWQGFVIWICERTGGFQRALHYVDEKSTASGINSVWWSEAQLKSGINDLLLCFEVLFFSVLHLFAYPAREVETMPQSVVRRIEDPGEITLDRVLSAVNLMNLRKFRDEVESLGPGEHGEGPCSVTWFWSRLLLSGRERGGRATSGEPLMSRPNAVAPQ